MVTESAAESRLTRIAKAVASGATVTTSPKPRASAHTVASREANSKCVWQNTEITQECRQFLADFVTAERDEMRVMFYVSLRVIEHALSARKEYTTKDGQILQGGPDHYARLTATKHFRDFLAAGRPAPKHPEMQQQRGMTLDELRQLVESHAD
jgi:hypothetical protein